MGLDEGREFVRTIDDVPLGEGQERLVLATGVAVQRLEFFFTFSAEGAGAFGTLISIGLAMVAGW